MRIEDREEAERVAEQARCYHKVTMGDHTYLWVQGSGQWFPQIQARSSCVKCGKMFEVDFKEVAYGGS